MSQLPFDFGALAQLLQAQTKAEASVQKSIVDAQAQVESAAARADLLGLKARVEAAQRAQSQASGEEPPQRPVGDIMPVLDIDARAPGNGLRRSLGRGMTPAAAARGGAAVQRAAGLQRSPQPPGGQVSRQVPSEVTRTQTQVGVQPVRGGGRGQLLQFAPTFNETTTTEPNVLTPAQALSLQQQEVELQESTRRANIALAQQLSTDLDGPAARKAIQAAVRGDLDAVADVVADNESLSRQVRRQQLQESKLKTELLQAQLDALQPGSYEQLPLGVRVGLVDIGGGPANSRASSLKTQEDVNQQLREAFRKDDEGRLVQLQNQAALRTAQGASLNQDRVLIVQDEGGITGSDFTSTVTDVPASQVVQDIALVQGRLPSTPQERAAARRRLTSGSLRPLGYVVGPDGRVAVDDGVSELNTPVAVGLLRDANRRFATQVVEVEQLGRQAQATPEEPSDSQLISEQRNLISRIRTIREALPQTSGEEAAQMKALIKRLNARQSAIGEQLDERFSARGRELLQGARALFGLPEGGDGPTNVPSRLERARQILAEEEGQ